MTARERRAINHVMRMAEAFRKINGTVESTYTDHGYTAVATAEGVRIVCPECRGTGEVFFSGWGGRMVRCKCRVNQ